MIISLSPPVTQNMNISITTAPLVKNSMWSSSWTFRLGHRPHIHPKISHIRTHITTSSIAPLLAQNTLSRLHQNAIGSGEWLLGLRHICEVSPYFCGPELHRSSITLKSLFTCITRSTHFSTSLFWTGHQKVSIHTTNSIQGSDPCNFLGGLHVCSLAQASTIDQCLHQSTF